MTKSLAWSQVQWLPSADNASASCSPNYDSCSAKLAQHCEQITYFSNCFFIIVFLYLQEFLGNNNPICYIQKYCHSFINMANQDSPLVERLGMEHYLTPPWMSHNAVKAIKLRVLIVPQEQKTTERGQPFLMVNNRATYQRQSWIPEAPAGVQVLFIPAASDDNHLVPAIIEEHKLYFNLCIIPLCLCWTQTTIPPGIYIKQIDQTCTTLIKVCMMP